MKKFFVTAALAVVLASAGFAADGIKVSKKIQSSFQKEFATAFNPSWESVGSGILHVNFQLHGQVMDAYFAEDGELVSFARYISAEQLPLLVNKTVEQKFAGANLRGIQELVNENETSYLITAHKNNSTIVARIFSSGEFQVIKKTKIVKEKN